jgi:hypothetical protein
VGEEATATAVISIAFTVSALFKSIFGPEGIPVLNISLEIFNA